MERSFAKARRPCHHGRDAHATSCCGSAPAADVLGATLLVRNDLARVAQLRNFKNFTHGILHGKVVRAQVTGPDRRLFNADPVFTTDRSTEFETSSQNLLSRFDHPVDHARNSVIKIETRVKVSVPSVENVRDSEASL